MMDETDAKLAALFAGGPDIADDGFTGRVLALAAFDEKLEVARRIQRRRWATEAATLGAVVALFAVLARVMPEPEGIVPLGSPAMIGLALLATWAAIGPRSALQGG